LTRGTLGTLDVVSRLVPRVGSRRERADGSRLAQRMSRVPANVQPFLDDFTAYVASEARDYVKSTPRPRSPAQFRVFVTGFLARIAAPLEMVQQVVIAAAYRWPASAAERITKAATGAASAATAGYGQTIAYGSALTATAGALTVGVVGEMIELYAVASARTNAYRWAGLYPGEQVIASDLEQILQSKHLLAAGTRRHVGDQYLTALLDVIEREMVDSIVVPLVGPARAAYRSVRNVGLAFDTPLTRLTDAANEPPPRADVSLHFRELLARFEGARRLPHGWATGG
jgi:hypothetical protein